MSLLNATKRFARQVVPFPLRSFIVRKRGEKKFYSEAPEFALPKSDGLDYTHEFVVHKSPLRRQGTTYSEVLQQGKEKNVTNAANRINGTLLAPGKEFSYHHAVGPPTKARGFVKGAELHDGVLKLGIGGGCCQVSNLLYVLALLCGAEVTQRYRHGFDLFPDSERTVPFGCGATVFFPHRDLRFRNRLDCTVMIGLTIEEGHLVGRIFTQQPRAERYEIFEIEGKMTKQGNRWLRENKVVRKLVGAHEVELVAENNAICLYEPISDFSPSD